MTKKDQTPVDFLVHLISPPLIMVLVGSLVFFLVEIFYIGEFYGRLVWVLFFFIFGAVLVSRVSLQSDIGSRAGLYGLVLGGLTWLALTMFLEFPEGSTMAQFGWLVNLVLIALIWFSAHKLVVDCTLLDEAKDASGAGLLDVAGMDQDKTKTDEEEPEPKKKTRRKANHSGVAAWWDRYQQYRDDQEQKPKTHGLWVVYFSLAALPIFGIGQSLIPPSDTAKRQYVFWLMTAYIASGLGLMLTTAFLSLRRYLRQRGLQMPITLTMSWLSIGCVIILALLIVGALIPRPNAEYPLLTGLPQFGSPDAKPSEWAMKQDEAVKGKGAAGEGQQQNPDGPERTGKKGDPGNQKREKNSGGENKGQDSSDKKGQNSSDKSQNNQSQSGQKQNDQAQQKQNGDKQAQAKQDQQGDKKDGGQNAASTQPMNPAHPPTWSNTAPSWLQSLAQFLKWLVLGIIILLIVFFILKTVLNFLSHFTFWAKGLLDWFHNFWNQLWHRREHRQAAQQAAAEEAAARLRPFRSFADPFQTGTAKQMSAVELIRYTFHALEAWAREHNLPRPIGETPLEFAKRLGQNFPELKKDVNQLAQLTMTAAYAPTRVDEKCKGDLRQFWLTLKEMEANIEQVGA
jgi:hypothetical protein